ncbi:MAG: hypothetical protein MZV65_42125 [Chromatiales bacterium]|nr:hypothetical protein [Chromatiales bacterium]
MNALTKGNLLGKAYILVGINILKSLAMAQYLDREIPGVVIPQGVMDRMEKAGDGADKEGFQLAFGTDHAEHPPDQGSEWHPRASCRSGVRRTCRGCCRKPELTA